MIKGKDIVIVGLQPWDISIGSNCKNIALELSRHNRVLYVNPPLDRSTVLKNSSDELVKKRLGVIKQQTPALVPIQHNLWNLTPEHIAESINWIGSSSVFHWLNKINNRRLAKDILKAIDSLSFKSILLFNDQSMIRCFYLKELLKPEMYIYYIRDNLSPIPYFKKYALKMEEQLIAEADIVATNSEYLAEYARKFNKRAAFVGQGCDFSLYDQPDQIPVSIEMLHFPRPVIGYTGFLTNLRLDISLLEHIAATRPDWQLVLVGPEDDSFRSSNLHSMSNVHFLGNKTPETLPSYIKSFDVAINPQVVNEVTRGNYPRKIDEYLAMGKPVVATYTPFMEYFKSQTYLAKSKEHFVELIEQALREDSSVRAEERRRYALTHTWESNVESISDLIEHYQSPNVQAGI